MKKSYIQNGFNVLIRKDACIKFPNICFVCGKNCDNQSIVLSGVIDEYFGHWKHFFLGSPKVSIPVHQNCAKIHRKNSTIRGTINFIFLLISAGAIYLIYRTIDKYLLIFSLFSVLIFDRFVLDHYLYKEPIKFGVDKDRYKFTFMNKEYAEEFESLNNKFLYKERLLGDFGAKTKH